MLTKVFESETGVHWLDVCNPSPEELAKVALEYGLHSTSVQDCLDPIHLPKLELIGSMTFLILRAYDEAATVDADTVQELTRKLAIFFSDRTVITIHRTDQPYLSLLRTKWAEQDLGGGDGILIRRLLCELVRAAMYTYESPIDQAVEKLEELETMIFRFDGSTGIIEDGYYLRRKAAVFKRVLRLSMDIVPRLATQGDPSPLIQDLKESADKLYFFADELHDNINGLLNLHISLSSHTTTEASHRTNEVMRVLTIFSAFFLPLNFVAGIYGMNFVHMPGLQSPLGMPSMLLFMVATAIGIFLLFRRKGWL